MFLQLFFNLSKVNHFYVETNFKEFTFKINFCVLSWVSEWISIYHYVLANCSFLLHFVRYTSPTDMMMSPVTKGLLARNRKGGALLPPGPGKYQPKVSITASDFLYNIYSTNTSYRICVRCLTHTRDYI